MTLATRAIFGVLLFCFHLAAEAQDVGSNTLISQSRTTTANIGKSDITIKYHSPSVNGRKIFGGIVPFDFVVDGIEYPWRAGSNQRTTIEFSHDVVIEGKSLLAGTYGFVVLVSEDEWVLIFSEGKSWGTFNYKAENDVLRVPVKTKIVSFQEWLSYDFLNLRAESIDISLRWEKTMVMFNVKTDARANMLRDLMKKDTLTSGDYQDFANLTLQADSSNIDEAIDYLNKSLEKISDVESEVMQRVYEFSAKIHKGDLLLEKGVRKEGEKLRKEALAMASGFDIYYYALRKYTVEGKKKEAYKILNEQVKKNPENFQNHFAFGEYYLKEKNQEKAVEHFKKAFELSNDRWKNYARYLYLQNKLVLENM